MHNIIKKIIPNWQTPNNIKSIITTRHCINKITNTQFFSQTEEWKLFIKHNKKLLQKYFSLPSSPIIMDQSHSNAIFEIQNYNLKSFSADAMICYKKNIVCTVLTADCLPILICNKAGNMVATIHAGWKGLINNIIPLTIEKIKDEPQNLLVWIGPSICSKHYTVQKNLIDVFINKENKFGAFITQNTNKSNSWNMNLKQIAAYILENCGITNITITKYCTYCDNELFFSYRKGDLTERIISLIWFD